MEVVLNSETVPSGSVKKNFLREREEEFVWRVGDECERKRGYLFIEQRLWSQFKPTGGCIYY